MPQQQQHVLQSNRGILKKVSTAESPCMELAQASTVYSKVYNTVYTVQYSVQYMIKAK